MATDITGTAVTERMVTAAVVYEWARLAKRVEFGVTAHCAPALGIGPFMLERTPPGAGPPVQMLRVKSAIRART